MKKVFLLVAFAVMMGGAGNCWAQSMGMIDMGNYHWGFKVDYFKFTDDDAESLDIDEGPYVGVEFFGRIAKNLYLGGEVGYYNEESHFYFGTLEITYVPVELNLKYVMGGNNWAFCLGGGPSYNYAKAEGSSYGFTASDDDWFWGGQAFVDLNYVGDVFFLGINSKYQVVEDDLDNWRIGGQIGVHF